MFRKTWLALLCLFLNKGYGFSQTMPTLPEGEKDFVFKTAVPEDEGFSSAKLAALFPYVREHHTNIHSLMIIRDDKMVLDAYFYPYHKGLQHDIASCTKSITSLLIGIAIDKGFIPNIDQLVKSYFPEIKTYSRNFDSLTIRDLLSMTSGLDCGFNNEEVLFSRLFKESDWPAFIFNIPSIAEPGKQFSYCSCNFALLAEILYRATKLSPEEFAKKYLFKEIGIEHSYWTQNSKGVNYGWGDLALLPYDMAKIGRLLMNNGSWNGVQVVSANYVQQATSIQVPFKDGGGYGFGFWVDNAHAFNAEGRGGQRIHVDRLYKLILVATAGALDWGEKDGLDPLLGRSFGPVALPEDQGALDTLHKRILDAANFNGWLPVQRINTKKSDVLFNKTMIFGENSLHIKDIRIIAGEHGDTIFRVTTEKGKTTDYPFGIWAKYHYFKDSSSNHVFALRGYWKEPESFEIDFNTLTKIDQYFIDLLFGDNPPQATIEEATQGIHDRVSLRVN